MVNYHDYSESDKEFYFLDIERQRLDYQKRYLRTRLIGGVSFEDIYNRGTPYSEYSNEEKYILYRLGVINPNEDSTLYGIMYQLMRWYWNSATEYQVGIEEEMIESITRKQYEFSKGFFDGHDELMVSVGEIFLYFAERFSSESGMSVAGCLDLFLSNIGVIDCSRGFDDGIESFLKSDYEPDQLTIFDGEYYDWNSCFYCDGRYLVPSWIDQYEYFAGLKIVPPNQPKYE